MEIRDVLEIWTRYPNVTGNVRDMFAISMDIIKAFTPKERELAQDNQPFNILAEPDSAVLRDRVCDN